MLHGMLHVLSVASATAPGLAAAPGSAQAAGGGTGWRTAAVVSETGFDTGLSSVAAASPRRAWAVGFATSRRSTALKPVVESWDGSAWSAAQLPPKAAAGLGEGLITAAATGRGGLWAFTLSGHWLHGDGDAWAAGKIPGRRFVQVSLIAGPDTVWAFGGTGFGASKPFAAHRTAAGTWRQTAMQGKGVVAAASAVSGRDI